MALSGLSSIPGYGKIMSVSVFYQWFSLFSNEENNNATLVVLVELPFANIANISRRSTELHRILEYNHVYYS